MNESPFPPTQQPSRQTPHFANRTICTVLTPLLIVQEKQNA